MGGVLNLRIETNALCAHGALWRSRKWGLGDALYRVPADNVYKALNDQIQADFHHRLQSLVSDSYLSIGLGWEKTASVRGSLARFRRRSQ